MPSVVLYTTSFCPYCFFAKRLLGKRRIAYEEHSMSRSGASRAKLAALSGGGRTFPQVLIEGEPIGGFAELRRLDRTGALLPA